MDHPGIVLAHNIGERYELPIPLTLFAVGGAAVVLVSFLLVLRLQGETPPATDAPDPAPPLPFPRLAGPLSILVILAIAVIGITGVQAPADNLASVFFWILLWIGVPLSCGALGDWTRPVNPFANLARLGDHAGLRKAVLARRSPLAYPRGLAWWPALGLFVLLVLGELVFNSETLSVKPAFVGTMLIVYSLASFFLGMVFGPEWVARGEVFSVLWNTWGRQGWFRFGAPGRRGFAGGLDVPFETTPSRVLLVLLLLISINFDGLLATPAWVKHIQKDQFALSTELTETAILAGLVIVLLGVFTGFAVWSARLGRHKRGPFEALAGLLPSLVPIAYGYLLAHNLQYLMIQLQQLYPLVQNPGYGNTQTSFVPNRNVLPAKVNWYIALVVIVAVHVIAVVLAHRQLARSAPDEQSARRSEYPWLVAMVGYTAFSLVLIALPLTQASG
jgi:hypothetical protein